MKQARGFTLIEVLIAIVVIAILAGIGMVGYGEWRKDVVTKELQADLRSASAAMEQEKNFKNAYPARLPSSYKSNTANIEVYVQNAGAEFCMEAASTQPPLKFHVDSSDQKIKEGGCPLRPNSGGSAGSGTWTPGGPGNTITPPRNPRSTW